MREIHDIHDVSDYESLIDPKADCQVWLFTSAASIPVAFAQHPWFVVNKGGNLHRFEVLHWRRETGEGTSYVHKDFLPPFLGMRVFIHYEGWRWQARLLSAMEGEIAFKLVDILEQSQDTYPWTNHYHLYSPNSNTYAQWVIDQVPELEVSLPWNAFGKKYP